MLIPTIDHHPGAALFRFQLRHIPSYPLHEWRQRRLRPQERADTDEGGSEETDIFEGVLLSNLLHADVLALGRRLLK